MKDPDEFLIRADRRLRSGYIREIEPLAAARVFAILFESRCLRVRHAVAEAKARYVQPFWGIVEHLIKIGAVSLREKEQVVFLHHELPKSPLHALAREIDA